MKGLEEMRKHQMHISLELMWETTAETSFNKKGRLPVSRTETGKVLVEPKAPGSIRR